MAGPYAQGVRFGLMDNASKKKRPPISDSHTPLRVPNAVGERLERFARRNSLNRNAAATFLLSDALERAGFPMVAEDELDGPANSRGGNG